MEIPRRSAWVEIDLKAITENVKTLKSLLQPNVLFMVVVKADGYGHGAVPVSRAALAGGADRLGVALLEEGINLKQAGITAPIHVLSELSLKEVPLIIDYDLIPTVYTESFATRLNEEAVRRNKKVKLHLKIDTGMNRVGVPVGNALDLIEKAFALPSFKIEGIFTHFALADNPTSDFTRVQFERFQKVLNALSVKGLNISLRHAANSAATILYPESRLDMVRCGISVYGLHPSGATKDKIALTPALALKAKIPFIKTIASGEGVSYGHTFKAKRPTRLATLPLGYADGYTRLLSNRSHVLIRGKRAPVIGNICMDQLMVDVSQIPEAQVGDEVVLIGDQKDKRITADELAGILGTINYEITCMLNKRLPRIYLQKTED